MTSQSSLFNKIRNAALTLGRSERTATRKAAFCQAHPSQTSFD